MFKLKVLISDHIYNKILFKLESLPKILKTLIFSQKLLLYIISAS